MAKDNRLVVNIELTGIDKQRFEELKQRLGLKQNTEVLRAAIKHTNSCSRMQISD